MTSVNPVKGQIKLHALDQDWIAVSGFTALCEIEERFDKPASEVMADLFPSLDPADADDPAKVAAAAKTFRFAKIRQVMKAMLQLHQPDIDDLTVGEIVQEVGLQPAIELILGALMRAMAPAEAGDKNPPGKGRRKGSTGTI